MGLNDSLGAMQGSVRVSVAEEREHDGDIQAKRIIEIPSNLQQRISYNGDLQAQYVGFGARGLASDVDGWLLQKFTYDANKQMTLRQIAYGNWDNRASETYA